MLYVIAGNARQASDFARQHRLIRREWEYVSSPVRLRGVDGRNSFAFVGEYYARRDIGEIEVYVQMIRTYDHA